MACTSGPGSGWRGAGHGVFLHGHVGVQVNWVVSMLSWPSQSAMTVLSIPAVSSRIAAVCLSTCGVTFLAVRLGRTSRLSRCAAPARRDGVAAHPGSGSGGEHESFSVTWSFGGERRQDLHGLPVQGCGSVLAAFAVAKHVRTGPRWTSPTWSTVSSETRSPAVTASWNMAWSRRPALVAWSGAASSAVTSVSVR